MLHGPEHAAGAKGPAEAPRVSLDIPVSIEVNTMTTHLMVLRRRVMAMT